MRVYYIIAVSPDEIVDEPAFYETIEEAQDQLKELKNIELIDDEGSKIYKVTVEKCQA